MAGSFSSPSLVQQYQPHLIVRNTYHPSSISALAEPYVMASRYTAPTGRSLVKRQAVGGRTAGCPLTHVSQPLPCQPGLATALLEPTRSSTRELEPERRFELLTCALRGRSEGSRYVPGGPAQSQSVLVTVRAEDRSENHRGAVGRSGTQCWDRFGTGRLTMSNLQSGHVVCRRTSIALALPSSAASLEVKSVGSEATKSLPRFVCEGTGTRE